MQDLNQTIRKLHAQGKGIMACDESPRSMARRFEAVGVGPTPETRRQYFSMLFGTTGIESAVGGVILYEDLLDGSSEASKIVAPLVAHGILIGVRADRGAIKFPGKSGGLLTLGLDSLSESLDRWAQLGASFVKWRAAFSVDEEKGCGPAARANCVALALYATMALERGLLPIVEAEIEMDGAHSSVECGSTTKGALQLLFETIAAFGIDASEIVLKTNFVVPGNRSGQHLDFDRSADMTVDVLRTSVPHDIPLIAFLSGGMSSDDAITLLDRFRLLKTPWKSTFSFGRALWMEPLKIWAGDVKQVDAARSKLRELALSSAGVLQ